MLRPLPKRNWKLLTNGEIMLRKRRRISESIDDDPMGGLNNLSDAMLVLALGFLIFAIMALSVNPDMITQTQSTKDVSTADTFSQNYNTYVNNTIQTEKDRQTLLARQQLNQQIQKY